MTQAPASRKLTVNLYASRIGSRRTRYVGGKSYCSRSNREVMSSADSRSPATSPVGQRFWFHFVPRLGHPFASSLALSVLPSDQPRDDGSHAQSEKASFSPRKGKHLRFAGSSRRRQGYTLPIPRMPHLPLMRAISIVTDHPALALLVTDLGSEIAISSSPSRNPSNTTLPRSTLLIVS